MRSTNVNVGYSNAHVEKHPDVVRLRKHLDYLSGIVTQLERESNAAEKRRFLAAGGCSQCLGRGWVVTWDTMDAMDGGYADYGSCPTEGCTPESRARSGLDASYYSKYDRQRGTRLPSIVNPLSNDTLAACMNTSVKLQETVVSLNPCVKGRVARVAGGRKVPVGTTGTVFWVGQGKPPYDGLRLGIQTGPAREDVVWVDAKHCIAVLNPF